uniref:Transcriptional protein SWT1 n=1 Tax=Pygocentrus nattereri TaxID=42514 RepID=A0AAR2JLB7_PYGNA
MTKKKSKAKKHKKERKRSPTPPCEDRRKRKDDRETPDRSKERKKHEHVSRRKSSGSSQLSTEDSPKKETYKNKSDVKIKQTVFRNKISQDSDYRASHSSVKCSSLEYYVPSTGKSSSSQTPSRSSSVVSSKELEEQRKKLVKRRSTSEEPRQRSPKAAFLPEEKSKKLEKRKSLPEEGCPAAKRWNTAEQVDVGVVHRKSAELTEQRKKLVDRRSRELRKEVVSEGKCSCPIKRESEHSKEASSSIKNTNATQHVGPKMQDSDRQRGQSHSATLTCHQTSGVEPSSCLRLPVTFKIPKKSSVVKPQTDTDVWDNRKTSAVIKKHSIPVSVSSPPAQRNKLRPTDVSARVPPYLESHKTSSPQVQLGQSSPLRERSSPRNTAIQQAVCQGTSTVHTETFDNDQEMQLVEELHLARSDKRLQVNVVESCGELTCMDVDPPEEGITEAHSHGQHLQDLFIVLDTNVLLSHLDFVKKMRSHGLGALGFPTLLVPWVVLQELDSLKSGKLSREVEHKARPAVHYIYSCLKSQEPRLWGQSMQQASQASCGLGVVNNDDRVLQCCLQYQMLYPEGTLILCTNDKNLCSKALLSGVNALSKADLWEQAEGNLGLLNRSHSQHAARPPVGHTKEEHERKLCDEKEEASRRTASCAEWQLSECVPVLESNLQSALSAVLEEEMKAAYGELWTEIVYLNPPWTLETVLQCFRKHWIAVFGNIIKRNLLSCVEMLSSCLCLGASVERSSVLTALRAAEELLMELSSRSQYSGHVATALSCFQTLRHRLQGQEVTVEDTSDGDTLMAEAVEDVAPPPQTSPNEVWAFFESLWNNVCRVSSTLFSALQYSPDSVETVQLLFTTPPQDALTCLHRLSTALTQLLEAFQRVLSVDSTVEDAQTLLTVIHTSEIAAVEPRFTAKDLFECLSQREYRGRHSGSSASILPYLLPPLLLHQPSPCPPSLHP